MRQAMQIAWMKIHGITSMHAVFLERDENKSSKGITFAGVNISRERGMHID